MSVFVTSTWTTAQPSSSAKLIEKVARIYGLHEDDEAKALAKDSLDDVIKEMNSHTFEFNLMRQDSIALSATDSFVGLASTFFKEKITYLVDTATGNAQEPLVYLDWATFQRLHGNPTITQGLPAAYTSFNVQEEGRLYFGPRPNDSVASDYTLTTEFYRRIPLVSEVTQLTVPQEIENALLYGAWQRMAEHVQGVGHPDAQEFERKKLMAIEELEEIDRKHPDEATRFRIYDRFRGQGRGARFPKPLLLKIS